MDKKRNHTDPRIVRTRQLLKGAFIELLQEMDMEKISVNRIAERATINRVTFYLHYRDIPDMMDKMAADMIHEITTVVELPNQEATKEIDWGMMERFLNHIAENGNFYKTILTSNRISIFRDRLLAWLTDMIVSRVESRGADSIIQKAGIQKDILLWYDSAALIGTIVAWLQNDMPYTPAYLAKQFYLIHKKG